MAIRNTSQLRPLLILSLVLAFFLPLSLATQTPNHPGLLGRSYASTLPASSPATPAASSLPTSLPTSSELENAPERNRQLARRQQAEGAPCPDEEGRWNCMTTRWQRCAAGHWSPVMDMSEGTVCEPSGLTYDFRILHEGDAGGAATSDAAPSGAGASGGGPRGSLMAGIRSLYLVSLVCGVVGVWYDLGLGSWW
ncbi:hypothetical protein SODALDRAFT_331028 [Sodiomyces alkalinus F11]|uniref:Uncharacterized protein n=1 Tax=Sodiomyces alkalinus (strain CBS 110278 / VKM F-3762 / F11) TaxID=1314773 RepID=A0A3N2Q3U5_SODAK|nr:hypothetical protein SODALDRAFT_331028 [Sodiomyces alkalinus F11]ROT41305.1 hypothetical protein SODALDRAFT_331028 [Sodiomyces alkalinus F11]